MRHFIIINFSENEIQAEIDGIIKHYAWTPADAAKLCDEVETLGSARVTYEGPQIDYYRSRLAALL